MLLVHSQVKGIYIASFDSKTIYNLKMPQYSKCAIFNTILLESTYTTFQNQSFTSHYHSQQQYKSIASIVVIDCGFLSLMETPYKNPGYAPAGTEKNVPLQKKKVI